MKVKRDSLVIQNPLCFEDTIPHVLMFDVGERIMETINASSQIYCTAPFIFQVEDIEGNDSEGKYAYYFGISEPVENMSFAKQMDVLEIHPALCVRCTDTINLGDAYEELDNYAKKHQLKINPNFYHVCFEVEGIPGIIMDIYAAIEGEG